MKRASGMGTAPAKKPCRWLRVFICRTKEHIKNSPRLPQTHTRLVQKHSFSFWSLTICTIEKQDKHRVSSVSHGLVLSRIWYDVGLFSSFSSSFPLAGCELAGLGQENALFRLRVECSRRCTPLMMMPTLLPWISYTPCPSSTLVPT